MKQVRWKRIAVLLLCVGISAFWGHQLHPAGHGKIRMVDFSYYYYAAKCVLHHQDAYDPDTVLRMLRDSGEKFPTDATLLKTVIVVITVSVNLPTTLFLTAPLAFLSWGAAQMIWTILTAAMLALAGYLMWSLADRTAPVLSGWLICLMLANCQLLLGAGNVAGFVVSLCIVAAWCFVKEHFIPAAIVLFAISLCLKPHDSGFVWLYFLLAGGSLRKRALQTLAVVAVISILAAVWIAPSSPHWIEELRRNHVIVRASGDLFDPSPSGETTRTPGLIIDLQAALSVFRNDPRFYNLVAYLIVGPLIAIWAWVVLRRPPDREQAWLALAAISVLALLPVYHRPYDARLLMLTIPACATLWARGGPRRWLASIFTITGILATSDIPLTAIYTYLKPLTLAGGKVPIASLAVPASLLIMGCFYLWMFVRRSPRLPLRVEDRATEIMVSSPAHQVV